MSDLATKQLQATNNYLLVKLIEPKEELASSGLILPTKALDKPRWAFVRSVGPGLADITGVKQKPDFNVGDLVFLFKHAPTQISTEQDVDGELHVISEGDAWCKVKVVIKEDGGQEVRLFPLSNLIHVEPIVEQNVTAGGIYLPDSSVEKPTRCRVLSVGPGQRAINGFLDTPLVEPGDIIRVLKNRFLEINFNDLGDKTAKQFLIMYGDVIAIESRELPDVELDLPAA